MTYFDTDKPQSILMKMLLLTLASLCLLLGVIGLLLPIIPGIVFLVLGAWLLARASSRAAAQLDTHPGWQKGRRFWLRSRYLNSRDKLRLTVLLACRSLVDGIRRIVE